MSACGPRGTAQLPLSAPPAGSLCGLAGPLVAAVPDFGAVAVPASGVDGAVGLLVRFAAPAFGFAAVPGFGLAALGLLSAVAPAFGLAAVPAFGPAEVLDLAFGFAELVPFDVADLGAPLVPAFGAAPVVAFGLRALVPAARVRSVRVVPGVGAPVF